MYDKFGENKDSLLQDQKEGLENSFFYIISIRVKMGLSEG